MKFFLLFVGLIVFIIFWLFGGYAFNNHFSIIDSLFGTDDWENTFAPINALFAAIASAGAIYAISTQIYQFHQQQFESNFINLLNIYIENKKNLESIFSSKPKKGESAFCDYYLLLKEIYIRVDRPECLNLYIHLEDAVNDKINDYLDSHRDDYGKINKSGKDLFLLCHDIFDDCTEFALSQYFRHLFHVIKYINCTSFVNKKQFIGILRAQFGYYEYPVLYYDTLMHDDKKIFSKKSKFQILIEKHCLLHNIQKRLLFDAHCAGKYSDAAFAHVSLIQIIVNKVLSTLKMTCHDIF